MLGLILNYQPLKKQVYRKYLPKGEPHQSLIPSGFNHLIDFFNFFKIRWDYTNGEETFASDYCFPTYPQNFVLYSPVSMS
jgi:hypothetical protein